MFFVFPILLFTFYVTEINSFLVKSEIFGSRNNSFNKKFVNVGDATENITSSLPKFRPKRLTFNALRNYSIPKLNLDYNVEDKILPNEISSTKLSKNITAENLNLKPKWLRKQISTKLKTDKDKIDTNNKVSYISQFKHAKRDTKENEMKNKVVGIRNVLEESKHHPDMLQNLGGRFCTCAKTYPFTTCSHKGNCKTCTHTPKCGSGQECTSILYSPYPAFYVPYQSYFLSVTTDSPYKIKYYHPNTFNELKVPKKKKHRYPSTTPFDDDLYYEYSNNKANNKDHDYLENDKYSEKSYKQKKGDLLIDVEYDVRNEGNKKPQQGLNNVLSDLDTVYSDCAMKKCYCSSLGNNIESSLIFYRVIFTTLIHKLIIYF